MAEGYAVPCDGSRQTADRKVHSCIRIRTEIADEIGDKAKTVGFRPGVSVRTALVYDGALAPSIRTEHMLDFVIPADRLFKMN